MLEFKHKIRKKKIVLNLDGKIAIVTQDVDLKVKAGETVELLQLC